MKKTTFFVALLLSATTAFAVVPTSLTPVQDTYVDFSAPTVAKQGTNNLFVSNNAVKFRDTYIKFSLSGLLPTDAAAITSVKLKLTAGYTSGDASSVFLIDVRDVNFMDVDLNTLTYAGLSTTGLTAVPFYKDNTVITDFSVWPVEKNRGSIVSTYTGPVLVGTPIEIDLTSYVKWGVENGKSVVTLNIAKSVTDPNFASDWRAYFYTMEETAVVSGIPTLNFEASAAAVNSVKMGTDWTLLPSLSKNGVVTISNKSGVSAIIKVYDLNGKLVKSFSSTSNVRLNTRELCAGSYIAKIITSKGSEDHRFVVVK